MHNRYAQPYKHFVDTGEAVRLSALPVKEVPVTQGWADRIVQVGAVRSCPIHVRSTHPHHQLPLLEYILFTLHAYEDV